MIYIDQIIEGLSLRPKDGFFGYSSVTLVRDGKENILFDTGGYGTRSVLIEKLSGVQIHKVFLSHLHFDHCANISLFSNAEVYVHQRELDQLHSKDRSIYRDINNFIKTSLDALRIVTLQENLEVSENTRALLTPGHTIGHSSLEILSQKKRTVIAGDAIETYLEYLDDSFPFNGEDAASYYDSKLNLKSNFRIIIPGHSSKIEDGVLSNPCFSLSCF